MSNKKNEKARAFTFLPACQSQAAIASGDGSQAGLLLVIWDLSFTWLRQLYRRC